MHNAKLNGEYPGPLRIAMTNGEFYGYTAVVAAIVVATACSIFVFGNRQRSESPETQAVLWCTEMGMKPIVVKAESVSKDGQLYLVKYKDGTQMTFDKSEHASCFVYREPMPKNGPEA